jgi:hypothetical protein
MGNAIYAKSHRDYYSYVKEFKALEEIIGFHAWIEVICGATNTVFVI